MSLRLHVPVTHVIYNSKNSKHLSIFFNINTCYLQDILKVYNMVWINTCLFLTRVSSNGKSASTEVGMFFCSLFRSCVSFKSTLYIKLPLFRSMFPCFVYSFTDLIARIVTRDVSICFWFVFFKYFLNVHCVLCLRDIGICDYVPLFNLMFTFGCNSLFLHNNV